jgi:hypothetical protein
VLDDGFVDHVLAILDRLAHGRIEDFFLDRGVRSAPCRSYRLQFLLADLGAVAELVELFEHVGHFAVVGDQQGDGVLAGIMAPLLLPRAVCFVLMRFPFSVGLMEAPACSVSAGCYRSATHSRAQRATLPQAVV